MAVLTFHRRPCALALSAAILSFCSGAPAGAQTAPPDSQSVGPPHTPHTPEYTRVVRQERVRMSKAELQALLSEGKAPPQIDAATGEAIRSSVEHILPAGWLLERPEGVAPEAMMDSLGAPIVNQAQGLPAWAQRDVDALRASIADWRAELARLRGQGMDAAEAEGVLGNFIGQALTRSIDVDDIANIDDAALMSAGVANAVAEYLHYYENVRFANQELFEYEYTPAAYPARVGAFLAAHGSSLAMAQQIDAPIEQAAVPSGCYTTTLLPRGITLLSGQTHIFNGGNIDDQFADVPTGFDMFFFYNCVSDRIQNNNTSVRVSTNGYISFFQQGGGATNGTTFLNEAIGSPIDPDGFAAPWWDDLLVAAAQGVDRISFKTEGAIDQRVLTVEYFSISRRVGSADDFHHFQVKLFETSDVVEFNYGLDDLWHPDTLDNSTQGMEDFIGTSGDCGSNCGNLNSSPPQNNFRYSSARRPSIDNCEQALAVVNGFGFQQLRSLARATSDGSESCGASGHNRDVWYQFTAPCTGTLQVNTCGSRDLGGVGAGIDSVLSVHSGCPGTGANQLACNDDSSVSGCSSTDSAVEVPMIAGQNVKIRVSHFGDAAFRYGNGRYRIKVNFLPDVFFSADDCSFPIPTVAGDAIPGNLSCMTNDGSSLCVPDQNNDVWFSFTAPFNGQLTLDTCGSRNMGGANAGADTLISVHTGCPGTRDNQIACNDDSGIDGCGSIDDSRLTTPLTQGQSVRIRVTHFVSSPASLGNGQFVLHVWFPCFADFNSSDSVDSQDFFDFLTAFFAAAPAADMNRDEVVNSQDFFDFVAAFFNGC